MSKKHPAWPDGMDAAERVRQVATTRTQPRNAGWIAEEADVSRDTAVKYLTQMVERGDLEAIETERGTGYRPDTVTQFLDTVRQFADGHTVDELTQELEAISEDIKDWKQTYDVESVTALRQSIGTEDLTAEDRRERLAVIDDWEYTVELREAIQLAIGLKQSLTSLGVVSHTEPSVSTHPQEG